MAKLIVKVIDSKKSILEEKQFPAEAETLEEYRGVFREFTDHLTDLYLKYVEICDEVEIDTETKTEEMLPYRGLVSINKPTGDKIMIDYSITD